MRRAAGIITNRGGLTSHAAIVSRELESLYCGVPHGNQSSQRRYGSYFNGSTGEVSRALLKLPSTLHISQPTTHNSPALKTATKVYVNLAGAGKSSRDCQNHVDGAGTASG